MFDEKHIAAYRSIQAPAELKTRVMADCRQRRRPTHRVIQTLVACFAIFLVAGFVWTQTTATTIYVNNERLQGSKIALVKDELAPISQRNVAKDGGDFVISTKRNTKISVSDGSMQVYDVDTGELLFSGSEYSVKGKVAIQVNLDGEKATLHVKGFLQNREIRLECSR